MHVFISFLLYTLNVITLGRGWVDAFTCYFPRSIEWLCTNSYASSVSQVCLRFFAKFPIATPTLRLGPLGFNQYKMAKTQSSLAWLFSRSSATTTQTHVPPMLSGTFVWATSPLSLYTGNLITLWLQFDSALEFAIKFSFGFSNERTDFWFFPLVIN